MSLAPPHLTSPSAISASSPPTSSNGPSSVKPMYKYQGERRRFDAKSKQKQRQKREMEEEIADGQFEHTRGKKEKKRQSLGYATTDRVRHLVSEKVERIHANINIKTDVATQKGSYRVKAEQLSTELKAWTERLHRAKAAKTDPQVLIDELVKDPKDPYELIKWDGITPQVLVDDDDTVFGVLAGRPDDDSYLARCNRLYDKMAEQAKTAKFTKKNLVHRRASIDIYAKKLFLYYKEYIDKLKAHPVYQKLFTRAAPGDPPDPLGPYGFIPNQTRSWPGEVATDPHRDVMNLAFGWCGIVPIGPFLPSRSGLFVIHNLCLVIEFPPGSCILIPSAYLWHSNIPIHPDDQRASITFYAPSGLYRFIDNDFQLEEDLKTSNKKLTQTMSNVFSDNIRECLNTQCDWTGTCRIFNAVVPQANVNAALGSSCHCGCPGSRHSFVPPGIAETQRPSSAPPLQSFVNASPFQKNMGFGGFSGPFASAPGFTTPLSASAFSSMPSVSAPIPGLAPGATSAFLPNTDKKRKQQEALAQELDFNPSDTIHRMATENLSTTQLPTNKKRRGGAPSTTTTRGTSKSKNTTPASNRTAKPFKFVLIPETSALDSGKGPRKPSPSRVRELAEAGFVVDVRVGYNSDVKALVIGALLQKEAWQRRPTMVKDFSLLGCTHTRQGSPSLLYRTPFDTTKDEQDGVNYSNINMFSYTLRGEARTFGHLVFLSLLENEGDIKLEESEATSSNGSKDQDSMDEEDQKEAPVDDERSEPIEDEKSEGKTADNISDFFNDTFDYPEFGNPDYASPASIPEFAESTPATPSESIPQHEEEEIDEVDEVPKEADEISEVVDDPVVYVNVSNLNILELHRLLYNMMPNEGERPRWWPLSPNSQYGPLLRLSKTIDERAVDVVDAEQKDRPLYLGFLLDALATLQTEDQILAIDDLYDRRPGPEASPRLCHEYRQRFQKSFYLSPFGIHPLVDALVRTERIVSSLAATKRTESYITSILMAINNVARSLLFPLRFFRAEWDRSHWDVPGVCEVYMVFGHSHSLLREPPAGVVFEVLQLSPNASTPEDWINALTADFGTAMHGTAIRDDRIFIAGPRGLRDGFFKKVILPFIDTVDPQRPYYKEIMNIIKAFCTALAYKLDHMFDNAEEENRPPTMDQDGVEEISPGAAGPPTIEQKLEKLRALAYPIKTNSFDRVIAYIYQHLRHPDPRMKLHEWNEAQKMTPMKRWRELASVYHPDMQPPNPKYASKEWNLNVIKEICQIVTSIKK
ncbi:hypothetical protein NP233_g6055 [Leucocoprinus birnbaumii]|uniref:Uncharacterized protein n=1 Tax=Leucocoprinus birnbaumii TaxID=56174 RepID=A0AAD5YW48_9AGAR|nr:hypothetical protein NP233_g6055 [Leucocoprinus birnbaumii]